MFDNSRLVNSRLTTRVQQLRLSSISTANVSLPRHVKQNELVIHHFLDAGRFFLAFLQMVFENRAYFSVPKFCCFFKINKLVFLFSSHQPSVKSQSQTSIQETLAFRFRGNVRR